MFQNGVLGKTFEFKSFHTFVLQRACVNVPEYYNVRLHVIP
jgi:hypothetical protein